MSHVIPSHPINLSPLEISVAYFALCFNCCPFCASGRLRDPLAPHHIYMDSYRTWLADRWPVSFATIATAQWMGFNRGRSETAVISKPIPTPCFQNLGHMPVLEPWTFTQTHMMKTYSKQTRSRQSEKSAFPRGPKQNLAAVAGRKALYFARRFPLVPNEITFCAVHNCEVRSGTLATAQQRVGEFFLQAACHCRQQTLCTVYLL